MEPNDSPEIPDRGEDIRHPRSPFGGKGPIEIEIDTRTELKKKIRQARLVYVFDINCNILTT